MATLLQTQAAFVATQHDHDREIAAIRRDLDDIRTEQAAMRRGLDDLRQLMEKLPEAVREKVGFR